MPASPMARAPQGHPGPVPAFYLRQRLFPRSSRAFSAAPISFALICRRLARLSRFPSPGSEVGAPAGADHSFAEPSLAAIVHAGQRPAAAATAWAEAPRPFAGLRGALSVAAVRVVAAQRLVKQTRSPAAGYAPLAA